MDDQPQVLTESEEEIWESVRSEIDEPLNVQVDDVNVMHLDN